MSRSWRTAPKSAVDRAHHNTGEKPTLDPCHAWTPPCASRKNHTGIVVLVSFLLGLGVAFVPATLAAQAGRAGATRAELETLVSAANAGTIKVDRRELEEVQRRLTQGDFSVGDQIALTVAGEPTLTATFQVEPGPSLVLSEQETASSIHQNT